VAESYELLDADCVDKMTEKEEAVAS